MVITQQKPFEDILEYLKDDKKVFLVGCAQCATLCQTGGEEQIKELQQKLEAAGKTVTGWAIFDPTCHVLETKKGLRKQKEQVNQADSFLVMTCGGGVQAIRELTDKPVHPGCDTVFVGIVERFGQFYERCSLCGDCILETTGGYCPLTLCTKGLLSGPCGGQMEGKCEVDPERDCGWAIIYEHLKKIGRLDLMKQMRPPRDHSKYKPRSLILQR